jgi:ribosomal protein S18 acetylase RimI-like enzyme
MVITVMLALRPSRRNDPETVLRVLAAREARDFGVVDFIRGFLVERWRIDEFEPGADAVVAEDRGAAVGYGALFEHGALAFVDPDHEHKGAGSRLLEWVEARAVQAGRPCHRQVIAAANASGHALLGAAGYQRMRSVIQMTRALHPLQPVPMIPERIALDQLDVAADAHALHLADTASFAGTADYEPSSFEAFEQEHLQAPDLDPALSRVARRGEAIAGFTLCRRRRDRVGYVDLLAVDPRERGRGLGACMLATAFADFVRLGLHDARLDVASDNARGLRLYERAGMTERIRVDVFEKPAALMRSLPEP